MIFLANILDSLGYNFKTFFIFLLLSEVTFFPTRFCNENNDTFLFGGHKFLVDCFLLYASCIIWLLLLWADI